MLRDYLIEPLGMCTNWKIEPPQTVAELRQLLIDLDQFGRPGDRTRLNLDCSCGAGVLGSNVLLRQALQLLDEFAAAHAGDDHKVTLGAGPLGEEQA